MVDTLADPNLKQMMEAGLLVTLNSDDPAYFDGYLGQNFRECARDLHLTPNDIVTLCKNSMLTSWMSAGAPSFKKSTVYSSPGRYAERASRFQSEDSLPSREE